MLTDKLAAILAAILLIVLHKISTVDLGEEFDESNSYMKFGRNWVINNKLECLQVQTDNMRRPFRRTS